MNAHALHPGTEVEVDIRGRVFPAIVTGRPADDGRIPIKGPRYIGYYSAVPSQIRKVLARPDEQLQLGGSK